MTLVKIAAGNNFRLKSLALNGPSAPFLSLAGWLGQSNDVFRDATCSLTRSILCELQPAGTSL